MLANKNAMVSNFKELVAVLKCVVPLPVPPSVLPVALPPAPCKIVFDDEFRHSARLARRR